MRVLVRKVSDDGHQASAKAAPVVGLVSTADRRTERLRKLVTESSSRQCIVHVYHI